MTGLLSDIFAAGDKSVHRVALVKHRTAERGELFRRNDLIGDDRNGAHHGYGFVPCIDGAAENVPLLYVLFIKQRSKPDGGLLQYLSVVRRKRRAEIPYCYLHCDSCLSVKI